VTALHQVLPGYARWDAIGNHAQRVQALLHRNGVESEVFAQHLDSAPGPVRPAHELSSLRGSRAAVLYHLSTGSGLVDLLLQGSQRLAVDYHNVTPHTVFGRWEPTVGPELALGRSQLELLAPRAELAVADSGYNAAECREAGYRSAAVAPILLDVEAFVGEVDAEVLARLQDRKAQDGGTDWLFVGRVAPHKAQHDVLAAFAAYKRGYDPHARLTFVGGSSSASYWDTLVRTIGALGLERDVALRGGVPAGELNAHFQVADAFVCLSDHEGFCVPLLEAMAHRVPVVAFAAAAVPETTGGAAILLPRKEPGFVAAAVHRVVTDPALADRLRDAGTRRLDDYSLARTEQAMLDALTPLLEG
jgi:glycosyltransferase involved in cell wall biosynthesis